MVVKSLNDSVKEYTIQLENGDIQKAYQGIMTFISKLRKYLESKYSEYVISGVYFGYMDMTYFGFTPVELKKKNLKVAIVYLHRENRFDVWLVGLNRKIQGEYIQRLKGEDLGEYRLSQVAPGVDSIVEKTLVMHPNFNYQEDLVGALEEGTVKFISNIGSIIHQSFVKVD
ncbi:MAG: hypothetical protein EOM59_11265 [Clostridia bacterium]|nr:hypothetical protein [Clostridia bacterium]